MEIWISLRPADFRYNLLHPGSLDSCSNVKEEYLVDLKVGGTWNDEAPSCDNVTSEWRISVHCMFARQSQN